MPATKSPEYPSVTSPVSVQNWYLTLGAGLRYQPDYVGSDDYIFSARPIISLGRGLKSDWWSSEDDPTLTVGFFSGQGWRAGLSGDLLFKREADVNPALAYVPDTKFGVEAGGFAEFYPTSWLRARADLRHGFIAHNALVADLKLDAFQRAGAWTFGGGPRMRLVGADYLRTYYGSYDASGGGKRRFNGGVHTVGAIAQATYNWTEQLSTTAYVEYKYLVGDAAKAPLVKTFGSRHAVTFGISASYAFDTGFQ